MNESAAEAFSHRHFRASTQEIIAPGPLKITGRLVGVVADRAALAQATRLRRPPDFFELRLDALRDSLGEIERAIPRLRAPLILTARHPAEGGLGALSAAQRRKLLERFLDRAHFVDVELRSVRAMQTLVSEIRGQKIRLIISRHELRGTPVPEILCEQFEKALSLGADIFKSVTRTDNAAQLSRLFTFFHNNAHRGPIAAMGMGKLGAVSRRHLLRSGSALNYAAVGQINASGQLTLRQLRRSRAAYHI